MFKDDQMISFLTAIVLMVAIGTVIQKADGLGQFLGTSEPEPEPTVVLQDDRLRMSPGRLVRIDVLGNDSLLDPDQRNGLTVVRFPECGQVFVQAGALQYLSDDTCAGEQQIVYTIAGEGDDVFATAFVQVGDDTPVAAAGKVATAPASPAPQAPAPEAGDEVAQPQEATEQASAPASETTELAAAPKTEEMEGQSPAPAQSTTSQVQLQPVPAENSAPSRPARLTDNGLEEDPVGPVSVPGALQSDVGEDADADSAVVLATAPEAPQRTPGADSVLGDATTEPEDPSNSGVLVALVELREPPTEPPAIPWFKGEIADDAPAMETRLAALSPTVTVPSMTDLAEGPEVGAGLGLALDGSPVDLDQGPPEPVPAGNDEELSRLTPGDGPVPSVPIPAARVDRSSPAPASTESGSEPAAQQQAALGPQDAECVTPPSTSIDVRLGARTVVQIYAPCSRDTVAELQYSGLRFAVPLNDRGVGEVLALGLEPNSEALLAFSNGTTVEFDLPFRSIKRISRVALVWEQPINLELNAFEFGAEAGSKTHVNADNPRSFREVKSTGGGFLHSYRAVEGVGQNAEIYSFWTDSDGDAGIVRLMVDFVSRQRDRLEETCGAGSLAAPEYVVLRSEGGAPQRPDVRRLSALSCEDLETAISDERVLSEEVADLLIR